MNNLYDVLEICLQELENGTDMESILMRYPDLASELRPILKASINARMKSAALSDPSSDAVRRGRAKILQRASQMREQKIIPRRRIIAFFPRLAISFVLIALFLASGTGLVSASSTALPGENLYHVKLTWENVRLFFTFDDDARELLEHTFKNERFHEVNELLTEGRHETIQFSGIFMEANGQIYVAGIRVVILDTTILPVEPLVNGDPVIVAGRTNAQGFVEAESIQMLPPGTTVPVGEPPEIETSTDQNENSNEDNDFNEKSNDGVDDNENSNNDNNNDNASDDGNDNDNNNEDDSNGNNEDLNDDDSNDNDSDEDNDNGGGGDNDKNDDDSGGGDGGDD
jgi:Domain of unknown function (DUF5667)